MATGEWKVNWTDFENNVVRRIATAKRGALPILIEQAKGLIKAIIAITPPGNSQRDGITKKSKEVGENKILRDLIGRKKGIGRTGGIVSPMQRQFISGAKPRKNGTRSLFIKDGFVYTVPESQLATSASDVNLPSIHSNHFINGKFKKTGPEVTQMGKERRFTTIVLPDSVFQKYLKDRQKRVGYLMSGWSAAAHKLGISLPKWITDVQAPSVATVSVTEDRIRIVATNDAGFAAAAIPDRRIQSAIDSRAASMQREWEDYLKKLTR